MIRLDRHRAELDAIPRSVAELIAHLQGGDATLLLSSREERFNNAQALEAYLENRERRR